MSTVSIHARVERATFFDWQSRLFPLFQSTHA